MGIVNDILYSSNTGKLTNKALDIYAQRALLLTSNVANVETPGYKSVDMKPFENQLKDAMRSTMKMSTTNGAHLEGPGGDITSFTPETEVSAEPGRIDGNNVNLDKEIAALQENSIMYQAVLNARSKRGQIISETIDMAGR
ncbi:MAG: flagellar basal body rod protein FlgB [Nitrospinae bacterium]|nr:flagellar basal body rod protein FlgB [Nitrospinota bacterium]